MSASPEVPELRSLRRQLATAAGGGEEADRNLERSLERLPEQQSWRSGGRKWRMGVRASVVRTGQRSREGGPSARPCRSILVRRKARR
eukprot:scaffold343_cov245-Pinguiococcus_pyrenoidosus.AAC.38